MNTRMLPLALVMLGAPLLASAQQQNQWARACSMGMHAMMLGTMDDGMMRPPRERMGDTTPGRMGERMRGGMDGMMNDSSMMARMQSRLGLSDEQEQQLRKIHERACTAAQPHLQAAMETRQAAMRALQGDNPSLDHVEDQLDTAGKHMVEAQVEMAKGVLAARKVLTPAQRQQLEQLHQEMMQGRMNPD